jgi:nucleoside-diphosphate-sugar epimerase
LTKHISIVGCGWLGLPLAKHFIKNNYIVKGSTTSKDKLESLKEVGIIPFFVQLTQEGVQGEIVECLSESEILVLNIPPGLHKNPENDFKKQMSFLIPYVETSSVRFIIFVSSTSVFADDVSIPIITEHTIPNSDSESGQQLLKAEALFQNNTHFQTTILRFSGLFGDNRHPAKYLSGKTNLKNPDAPVNLIHLQDCIHIIIAIVKQSVWNETLNASASPHPKRKNYYTSVCKAMHLPLPAFNTSEISIGKLIDSKKLVRLLNYEFQINLNN